ncbi:FAD-dependent oxidoreductase [Mesorhizobium shangrilense]|uniref:FAD-dependent oxidoreductase n=1 Tax=Mesorhizobium shangrilense TaxID=460060 RepID=A0ABV2DNC9_9HYPH
MARDPKYDPLFEPIQLGPKTMKNRFYQTPQCNGAGQDLPGSQAGHRHMKAEGGWGAICTELCSISPETDLTPHRLGTIWDQGDVINYRHFNDGLHKHGALGGIELTHSGPHSNNWFTRAVARGPSAYQSNAEQQSYCAPMYDEDIDDVIRLHVEAAKRAVDAGFDIVYHYVADSMLVLQFLSPFYNKRTDQYGGSFENRARFSLRLLEETKKAVGDNCAIACRFSVDALLGADSIEKHEDGMRYLERVDKEGLVDLWDIKLGAYIEWGEDAAPSRFQQVNHERGFVEGIKGVVTKPVLMVGHMTSPDDMLENIEKGYCDIVGGTRASIADPFLPKKVDEGRLDDIRECIGCNMCVSRFEVGSMLVCSQNATSMEEYRRGWHPEKFEKTKEACSVLVVGAGPAGLECARVLGERGYDVHLREAEPELGGHLRDVLKYPGLSEWGRVTTYRETQLAKLKNVEVHRGTGRMTADDILEYGADKVVLAVGSRWDPNGLSGATGRPIPGADASLPQFATPDQVMAGKNIGQRVLVLDGEGFVHAIGMAEMMADQGKDVTILSQSHIVAAYLERTRETANLQRMMHEKGIHERPMHWVESFVLNGDEVMADIFYVYRDGYKRFQKPSPDGGLPRRVGNEVETKAFDSVILCTSRWSNSELYEELLGRKDEWAQNEIAAIYRAGDCYAPRLLPDAMFDGHRIAREFESENPQRPQAMIRERQIWGQETFPKLGDREVNG